MNGSTAGRVTIQVETDSDEPPEDGELSDRRVNVADIERQWACQERQERQGSPNAQ